MRHHVLGIDRTTQNPLCRIAALETAPEEDNGCKDKTRALNYDKEKYREMILDAAETVLGNFGFERTVYGDSRKRNGNGGRNL